MQKFRVTKAPEEIYNGLDVAVMKKSSCTIWQNQTEKKIIIHGFIRRIDQMEKVILFQPQDQVHLGMDKEKPIYVKLKFRDIVFKGQIHSVFKNTLAVHWPSEFHILELRSKKRRKMRLSQQNCLGILIQGPLQKQPSRLLMALLDLSPDGAACLASVQEVTNIRENSVLRVIQFGSKILREPYVAKVVHIIPMGIHLKINGHDCVRLGLQFLKQIPEEYFQFFEV